MPSWPVGSRETAWCNHSGNAEPPRGQRWDADRLELVPVEQRQTYTQRTYQCQIGLPANSVALIKLSTWRE